MSKLAGLKTLKILKNYVPLMQELVSRDLKIRYRRSVLGYLWSLLNPLLMMCVMSFVFSTFLKSNIPNFLLYLICGQTLWTFFSESTNNAMRSVIDNGSLIKKVYIPKFIFPISKVLSSFVITLFSMAAILIVMVATQATFHWTMCLFWVPLVFLFVFCCGIGLILASLSVYFRDVTHLWGVALMAWMYASAIFYDVSTMEPAVQMVIGCNPMYLYITFFRDLILYGQIPGLNVWLICIGSAAVALIIGLVVFKKLQRNFILYI